MCMSLCREWEVLLKATWHINHQRHGWQMAAFERYEHKDAKIRIYDVVLQTSPTRGLLILLVPFEAAFWSDRTPIWFFKLRRNLPEVPWNPQVCAVKLHFLNPCSPLAWCTTAFCPKVRRRMPERVVSWGPICVMATELGEIRWSEPRGGHAGPDVTNLMDNGWYGWYGVLTPQKKNNLGVSSCEALALHGFTKITIHLSLHRHLHESTRYHDSYDDHLFLRKTEHRWSMTRIRQFDIQGRGP